MKKSAIVCLLVFAGVSLQAQTLSWEIKLLKGRERESVQINRTIRMETGEVFQIVIKPASNCFAYVVCYDSADKIEVLYNEQIVGGNEVNLGPFEITTPSGVETLYVIMSLTRQAKLESLIQNYNNNPGLIQNDDNLRIEIAGLQKKASELGEPASVFIPSGGASRGRTEEYVTRFSDKDMYVRPIAIRH